MASRIEDYALLGNGRSAALVDKKGSIDWLCLPRFDSPSCFAALLGCADQGCWRLAPADAGAQAQRRYRPGSLILETDFQLPGGKVRIIDFMTSENGSTQLIRVVAGLSGAVEMEMELVLRFDYATAVPWVSRLPDDTGLRFIAGPDMVVLRATVPLRGVDMKTVANFSIGAGQSESFIFAYQESQLPASEPFDADELLARAQAGWRHWSTASKDAGEWSEAVASSLTALKGLNYRPTGGIVAAATTSLPELIGGSRNWDYRYCWLRDATLTLLALMNAGFFDEASAWREWLERAVAGSPSQLQIMYGVAGERRLTEWTADWLPGYENSAPVRIGNAAAEQVQLDVYGELLDALYQARKVSAMAREDDPSWSIQRAIVEHLASIWDQPDEGIWEVRGGKQQFTYSKVMAWVAVDRAIKSADSFGLPGPVDDWRALAARIHADVCKKGFNAERNCFVQYYGGNTLDASLLLIPTVGFLPAADPRIIGTLAAIEQDLIVDGLVRRYRTEDAQDGVGGGEGAFLACSFWLVDNLVLQNRMDEARELFIRLLALRNDVGLLSEEYDPKARRMLGNFPQAFSHVALINSAYKLARQAEMVKQQVDGHLHDRSQAAAITRA